MSNCSLHLDKKNHLIGVLIGRGGYRIQVGGGGGGRGPEGTVEQALPQDSIIASVSPVCGDVSATQIVPRRLVLEIKMIKSNIQYKKISKQSNTTMYVKRKKHSF